MVELLWRHLGDIRSFNLLLQTNMKIISTERINKRLYIKYRIHSVQSTKQIQSEQQYNSIISINFFPVLYSTKIPAASNSSIKRNFSQTYLSLFHHQTNDTANKTDVTYGDYVICCMLFVNIKSLLFF